MQSDPQSQHQYCTYIPQSQIQPPLYPPPPLYKEDRELSTNVIDHSHIYSPSAENELHTNNEVRGAWRGGFIGGILFMTIPIIYMGVLIYNGVC